MFFTHVVLRRLAPFAFLLFSTTSFAQEAPLTQDTFVVGVNPNNSFGTDPLIRMSSGGSREGLMQFDLSGFSGGVSSATLTFTVTGVNVPGAVGIWVVNGSWNQNTVTYTTRPNSTNSGLPPLAVAESDVGSTVAIDITSIVQNWVDVPTSNHGIALISELGAFNFSSVEGGMPAALWIESGAPPASAEWPEVSCPCDIYYSRAVDVFLSLGGVIHKQTDPPNVMSECESDVMGSPEEWREVSVYALRHGESDPGSSFNFRLSAVVVNPKFGLGSCHTNASVQSSDDSVSGYFRNRAGLSYEEAKACAASVLDYCVDWGIGTGNPVP